MKLTDRPVGDPGNLRRRGNGSRREIRRRLVERKRLATFLVFVVVIMAQSAQSSAEEHDDPSGVTNVVKLDEPDLRESSGLAVSNRGEPRFWTHNDSGKHGKLYAFDRRGERTGVTEFKSAKMNDWEDVASFVDQGVPRLLVADCGDNKSERSHIRLYLLDEPNPDKKTTTKDSEMQTIEVTYPDGPRDCEAVGVDVERGLIVLISKTKLPLCGVYTLPLPRRSESQDDIKAKLTRVTTLPIPMITALDINPRTGDLWIVSYFHTFCFRCTSRDMSIRRQLSVMPESYELPRWKQIEAVAIDAEDNLWVTSEGKETPMGMLSPEALAARQLR